MEQFQGFIAALYPDLKQVFEANEPIKRRISGVINRGLFEEVRWTSTTKPMRNAFANLENKQIVLDEGFLSYLWCVSCYIIGIVDIYQEKAMENPTANIARLSVHPMYRLFDVTLSWGRSLKDEYTPWPDYLPNPTQDSELATFTNHLWFYVIRYIMYHELGHLSLHTSSTQLVKRSKSFFFEPTVDELRRLRMMEIQADDYSLETLLLADENEYDRYMKYLGAAVAYLAGFFLLDDSDTRSNIHPDIDTRLQTLLKKVKGIGEMYEGLLSHTINIGLQVFMTITDVDFVGQRKDMTYQEFNDLQKDLFDALEELKLKYHIHRPFRKNSH
jgi:hypothetical protein